MIKKIILLSLILLLFVGCSRSEMDIADKPEKTIIVKVTDSEVVKLDGKEIHVSFLSDQISILAEVYNLT